MPHRMITIDVRNKHQSCSSSDRIRRVRRQFGLAEQDCVGGESPARRLLLGDCAVMLVAGPSGSGKSTLLRRIARQTGAVVVAPPAAPGDAVRTATVDHVAPDRPLPDVLALLTACGLGEPRLWIRPSQQLSDGEAFRAALASAVGRARSRPQPPPIVCDEFGSLLHRRLARCIAHNLRKLATRSGLSFVLAARDEDVLDDLQPDVRIMLGAAGPRIVRSRPVERPASVLQRACVEAGTLADYHAFAPMHYRARDGLGFVDRVFVARESPGGAVLAVVVYAHAPLELSPRNAATHGRFSRNGHRLRRELRILRRLVVHPDVRGCGVGHWLVRRTLPLAGVRFVECLATMGAVNPVFEKAGMARVGACGPPRGRVALLKRLRALRLDPYAARFEHRLKESPRVRRLVRDTICDWVKATRGPNASRPNARAAPAVLASRFRQLLGDPPLYYLWDRDGEFPVCAAPRGSAGGSPAQDDADDRAAHRSASPCDRRKGGNSRRSPGAARNGDPMHRP